MRAIVVLDDRAAATTAIMSRWLGAPPTTVLRLLAILGAINELEALPGKDREALVAAIAAAEKEIEEDPRYGSHTYLGEKAVKDILERALKRLAARGGKDRERARRAAELLHLEPP